MYDTLFTMAARTYSNYSYYTIIGTINMTRTTEPDRFVYLFLHPIYLKIMRTNVWLHIQHRSAYDMMRGPFLLTLMGYEFRAAAMQHFDVNLLNVLALGNNDSLAHGHPLFRLIYAGGWLI